MLLIIFGAGASYDSSPDHPVGSNDDKRIPLARDLFGPGLAEVARDWPKMDPILPYLRHTKGNVEDVLEDLRTEGIDDKERLRQLLAVRFYLHHAVTARQHDWERLVGGATNYRTLFDEVRRLIQQPVSIVTYNYDTLAENALAEVLAEPKLRWPIFKVHGSIFSAHRTDLLLPAESVGEWATARATIEAAPTLKTDGRIVSWNGSLPLAFDADGPLIPALAVPFRTKQTFEMSQADKDRLSEHLSVVTRLLVVGWRAEDDVLIKLFEAAESNIERLVIVSGSHPEKTMENLESVVGADPILRPGGFSEWITSRVVVEDLRYLSS